MMKKTIISPFGIEAGICKSVLSKARGLMFSSKKTLLFVSDREEHTPIHMLFVFFPIIVIWISKDKRIIEYNTLNPFSFHSPKKKSRYVLEIPAPCKDKRQERLTKNLKIGTKLKFRV